MMEETKPTNVLFNFSSRGNEPPNIHPSKPQMMLACSSNLYQRNAILYIVLMHVIFHPATATDRTCSELPVNKSGCIVGNVKNAILAHLLRLSIPSWHYLGPTSRFTANQISSWRHPNASCFTRVVIFIKRD